MSNYWYNLRVIRDGGGSPQVRYHDEWCPICNSSDCEGCEEEEVEGECERVDS